MWTEILQKLRKTINYQSFQTWLKPVTLKEETPSRIILGVPSLFFKNWLEEHYSALIKEAAKDLFRKEIAVDFVLQPREPIAPVPSPQTFGQRFRQAVTGHHTQNTQYTQIQDLNPKYNFASFVIGLNNRFAHAASLAVAESPAKAYNPLFIYGGVGLGKTHLMQAIGRYIKEKRPSAKLLYVPSETFVNQLIEAIKNRDTIHFRNMYRHVNILLIDDVHLFGGKNSTQEEFFHTFNTLYDAHKQIVVTSDSPPKDIPRLEERLVSRFEWGLVADVQPPDLETRIAILRKKVETENWKVPNDIIDFIAQRIKFNIRTLEGALNRVVAHASLTRIPMALESAKELLKDTLPQERQKQITIDVIKRNVCSFFDIRMSDLEGIKRNKNIALPRQIAMYISRQLTTHSLPEIGEAFGGRDHTTVIHACQNIPKKIEKDEGLRRTTNQLIEIIRE